MLIGRKSEFLLKLTQSKSKMYEYDVPIEEHVRIDEDVTKLLLIAIGSLDEISNEIIQPEVKRTLEIDSKLIQDLHFSAIFFDSLISSKIVDPNNQDYYYLLGAVSYFFCDFPGSAKVMLSFLKSDISVEGGGFEKAIWYVLNGNETQLEGWRTASKLETITKDIVVEYFDYFSTGIIPNFENNLDFFQEVLLKGTNREVFLCEILIALIKKKALDSALNLLPIYTDISAEKWKDEILLNGKLNELWPSQKRFGENGLFKQISGVVQMPTSSGKTTGVALIFQSLFLKRDGQLGIVIAPFRALCKEITRDLRDFFRNDMKVNVEEIFDVPEKNEVTWESAEDENFIFVLTPEKFLFLLRNDPTILTDVGLIIFDEAHLFDDPHRGTKYELLISTVKKILPQDAQTILISAVVPNATIINNWINDDLGVVISDSTLKAVEKSIAFSDLYGDSSRLTFLNPDNPDDALFYVPRVLEIVKLGKIKHDKKEHFFPDIDFSNNSMRNNHNNDISIYYSLKLLPNGSVAIFCGQKTSIKSIIERIVELGKRQYDISAYIDACVENEHEKIASLLSQNLGEDSIYALGASLGVFSHHADIPMGVKYSIEYAMTKKMIGTVVCTSTLAQGVNLPIKYLIVSNVYQAGRKISVRDFHNLIGRTGRAGKYTEGSVILAEPFVYNHRSTRDGAKKWGNYQTLIDPNNSEPCESTITQLVRPVEIWFSKYFEYFEIDLFDIFIDQYKDFEIYTQRLNSLTEVFSRENPQKMGELESEITRTRTTLMEIENYIAGFMTEEIFISPAEIAQETLGYFLANDEEKDRIISIFQAIYDYLSLLPPEEREHVSKESIGVFKSRKIFRWVDNQIEDLLTIADSSQIIQIVMPHIFNNINLAVVRNIMNPDWFLKICELWISGESYINILTICNESHMKIMRRGRVAEITIEEIFQICDKLFSYECLLPLAAIVSNLSEFDEFEGETLFNTFSKRLKYGLPDEKTVKIFELGFSDRYIAQQIALEVPMNYKKKSQIRRYLRMNREYFRQILQRFPTYFLDVLEKI